MRRLRAGGGALAATILAVAALAQTQTQTPTPTPTPTQTPAPQPTFRTEANYVRVDVYPTRDGAPVLDLKQDDFEVLESGTPQKIEQFEHVVFRGNVPQEMRREPNTVEESRQALENARARVFVVFLDIGGVDVAGSHNIRRPLVDTLNRAIGEEDLVGVMTPEMSARDVTFARKTTTIEGFLTRFWTWGDRDRLSAVDPADPVERSYDVCYADSPGIAAEMIARRREKLTLDALEDLVVYLRGAREERKAVLAITSGWRLYGPSQALANAKEPRLPFVGLNPATGKPTIGEKNMPGTVSRSDCDRDRLMLAQLEDEQQFRRILDEANRANTSFYPINPLGLPVFDSPISNPLPLAVDQAMLRQRDMTLRTLADATDGMAIVTNDLAAGLKRVVDDLSSYYLVGYYSTGKLDGKFHPITVRVKRPGVQVRARRGYLASTPAAATTAARSTAGAPAAKAAELDPAAAAEARAIDAVISPLAGYARDVPLRLQAAAGWKPADPASAAIWVVGELGSVALVGDAWIEGFDATATLTTQAGATMASGRVTAARGARTFRVGLTPSQPLVPGDYVLRVGASAGAASIPSRETLRIAIPAAPDSFGAIFIRRGPSTGNKDVPTADLRFRRSDQVRVEMPTASSDPVTARLLDRGGKPLAVPVTAALRDDGDGSRWRTAQLALAPLGVGDYVIEIASGAQRMLSSFRIVP
jgi:VWFA-related protein